MYIIIIILIKISSFIFFNIMIFIVCCYIGYQLKILYLYFFIKWWKYEIVNILFIKKLSQNKWLYVNLTYFFVWILVSYDK
jgi:hypothetical protein